MNSAQASMKMSPIDEGLGSLQARSLPDWRLSRTSSSRPDIQAVGPSPALASIAIEHATYSVMGRPHEPRIADLRRRWKSARRQMSQLVSFGNHPRRGNPDCSPDFRGAEAPLEPHNSFGT